MDQKEKMVAGIVVVSFFIFLITGLAFVYSTSSEGGAVPGIFQPLLQYHVEFMALMGLFGFFSGLVVYSVLGSEIQKHKRVAKANIGIIMKFLDEREGELVSLLLKKGGMTTQSEISRLPGMTRLKAHRMVKRLEQRGILHVEKYGKVNMVRIIDELKPVEETSSQSSP